ncbi:MAG: hypothetical protein K2J38_06845 [Muribaculaceae bacterium]|nr:hypothetical protein [Muribaculaceae bacterium]
MKQRTLLLGLGLVSAMAMQAASPFQGAAGPFASGTDYWLYQVESGKWLQNNFGQNTGDWTTRAKLGNYGLDIDITPVEDVENGYVFNTKLTGNGNISAGNDRFYLDTNNRSVWGIIPVTVDGVSNAYHIQALEGDGLAEGDNYLLGAAEGELSDMPDEGATTWQFVTRAERIEKMVAAAANGTQSATWLIPWSDMGRNNYRDRQWVKTFNSDGSGVGAWNEAVFPSRQVMEAWHRATNYRHYVTLTDIPNGTYEFTVTGYYRDTEVENAELQQRMADGTEVLRAKYFAGEAEGTMMPISKYGRTAETANYYYVEPADIWVPNNLEAASRAFVDGDYVNEWIRCVVTDGTLTVGIIKDEADHRDWLVYGGVQLRYVSSDVTGADYTALKTQLSTLIDKAKTLAQTPGIAAAVAEAEEVLAGNSANALRMKVFAMKDLVREMSGASDLINAYNATKEIVSKMGLDTAKADEMLAAAITRNAINDALTELRYTRRYAAADKQEDVFKGNVPAEGEFFLYNVGRKQFLCGGSDWGAHAALGMPGIALHLEAENVDDLAFHIETGLYNGAEQHYIGYRGYMDSGKAGAWQFVPVEGKENVYNIAQYDYKDVHWIWNPFASTDQGRNDETTVSTEGHNTDLSDPNAQWKLVTRAERDALLEEAGLKNPADATYFIASPNFNQRENAEGVWQRQDFGVWSYGQNYNDFAAESWNTVSSDMSQIVEGLPAGVYALTVQGFYRNGCHQTIVAEDEEGENLYGQPDLDQLQNALIYFGDAEELLPNIVSESGKVPGEGREAKSISDEPVVYTYPYNVPEATVYFKNGLYKTTLVVNHEGGDATIGVAKDVAGSAEDWVVVDNFRLKYYGADTTVEDVRDEIASGVENITVATPERQADNRIFNLQGIEVRDASAPGLYIRNGRKFIVR